MLTIHTRRPDSIMIASRKAWRSAFGILATIALANCHGAGGERKDASTAGDGQGTAEHPVDAPEEQATGDAGGLPRDAAAVDSNPDQPDDVTIEGGTQDVGSQTDLGRETDAETGGLGRSLYLVTSSSLTQSTVFAATDLTLIDAVKGMAFDRPT